MRTNRHVWCSLLLLVLLFGAASSIAAPAGDGHRTVIQAEPGTERGRLMLIWPMPTPARLTLAGEQATLHLGATLHGDPAPAARQLSGWLSEAAATPSGDELQLRLRPGMAARLLDLHPRLTVVELFRAPPATAPPAADTASAPARPTPRRFVPIPVSRPVGDPARAAAAEPARPVPASGPPAAPPVVKVVAAAVEDGVELRFVWSVPVPAAVYARHGSLWIVFGAAEATVAGWRSLAEPQLSGWLAPLLSRQAGAARLFRLELRRPVEIAVTADAAGWTVRLAAVRGNVLASAPFAGLGRDAASGSLQANIDGRLVEVNDPETGERLGVLLAARAGVRQPMPARLVDLELLPTAQGLAWRPLADGVRGEIADGRFVLGRRGGLRFSNPLAGHAEPAPGDAMPTADMAAAAAEPSPAPASQAVRGPLGLAALAGTDGATRQRERRQLAEDLRGGPQLPGRIALARLLLADGLGPEALAALAATGPEGAASDKDGELARSQAALAAAATALTGRRHEALAALERIADADQELSLWRAYAAAGAGRPEAAVAAWYRSGGILDRYPAPLQRLLGPDLASALFERGEPGQALALLDRLRRLDLPPEVRGRLDVLAAQALDGLGRSGDAEAALRSATTSEDWDTRTRAAYLRVALPAARGILPAARAADAMAELRPGWRGHPWEGRMLRRLAELQDAAGRDDGALATLQAARQTAEPAVAATLAVAIRQKLDALADAEAVDAATPLAMLTRYLTYADRADDDPGSIALRLRLATVAARNGLRDTARAMLDAVPAGARATPAYAEADLALARADAASGDLAGALQRVEGSAGGGAPAPAARALRAELRARLALAAGDPRDAAAALQDVAGEDAARLRHAALAQAGDWTALAASAAAVLPAEPPADPATIPVPEAAVWLGLAQAQLGQGERAAATRARFASATGGGSADLLRLATALPGIPAVPAAAGSFAVGIRAALDRLAAEPVAAIRSADGRSGRPG